MGHVLSAVLCVLVIFVGAQRPDRGTGRAGTDYKQVVVGRKGGRLLVLVALDGSVTALNPGDGKKQWTTRFGGPLLSSYSSARVSPDDAADAAHQPLQASPLIVPARDGSIMVASAGLTQLPYRAQDLVASAPWSLGQSGKSMMVGAKTSYMVEIELHSGKVLQTLTTLSDSCPADPPKDGGGLAHPSVWLGRNDFVVRAFDTAARQLLWNLTYSEVVPPALPSDAIGAAQPVDRGVRSRLAACAARQADDVFSATVHGEVQACDAVTGDTLWLSESVGAPLAHMYDVCFTATGESSYIEHRLREVWPASVEFRQQLLGAQLDGGGPNSGGDEALAPSFLAGAGSEVFVGALPGGQLYALPRSAHTTFDFSPPLEAYGADTGALLPAPTRDAVPAAATGSRDVVVLHADDGVVSDGPITAQWLAQCGALWDLTRDPLVEYQCIIGVHNVSAAVDAQALRALPSVVLPGQAATGIDGGAVRGYERPLSLLSSFSLRIAGFVVPAAFVPHIAAVLELVLSAALVVAAAAAALAGLAQFSWARLAMQRSAGAVLGWRRGRTSRRGRGGRGAAAAALDALSGSSLSADTVAGAGATPTDNQAASGSAGGASSAAVQPQRSLATETSVVLGGVVHRVIGRLAISDRVLGYGCNGTVVYAGQVDSRPVAIKRMLRTFHPTATREVSLLIRTDGHPNVVRYFACEEATDFVYLALELCEGTLAEEIARAARAREKHTARVVAGKLPVLQNGGRSIFARAAAAVVDGASEDEGAAGAAAPASTSLMPLPTPTPDTRRFLREIAAAIAHLHSHRIAHRDVKPANILLSSLRSTTSAPTQHLYAGSREFHSIGQRYTPKISDFGLGKQLAVDASSYGHSAGGPALSPHRGQQHHGDADVSTSAAAPGSVGWMAPEVLVPLLRERAPHDPLLPAVADDDDAAAGSGGTCGGSDDSPAATPSGDDSGGDHRWRRTRAADVWSLGCVFYHVVDIGSHPFGQSYERERNILRGSADLRRLLPAAPDMHDLVAAMVRADPGARPTADEVAEHPALWDDDRRLGFLVDLSDRLEREGEGSTLVAALESQSRRVLGAAGWAHRLPPALLADVGKYRKYDYGSLVDCLRLLRNKKGHFRELPDGVRVGVLGSADDPVALVPFFLARQRFPFLLVVCWEVARSFLAHEPVFAAHLGPHTAARLAARSRAAMLAQQLGAAAPAPLPAPAATAGVPVAGSGGGSSSSSSHPAQPQPLLQTGPPAPAPATARGASVGAALAPLQGRKSAPVAAPASASSRGWYATESEWHAAHAAVVLRVTTATGGPVVAATRDTGPDATDAADAAPTPKVMVVSAHARVGETRFSGGAHAAAPKYKSAPCKDWEASGGAACGRGVRCDFAHGPLELRLRPGGAGSRAGAAAAEDAPAAAAGGDAASAIAEALQALRPFVSQPRRA